MSGPLKDAPMALSAEGIWAGSCSIEQRSSTPGGCDNPGPSLTPSTGDALPPFGARAETFFSDGVPPYVLKTEGMPQKEAEARTQSPTPIGEKAVPVALPGPSTDGDQQPSSSAATNLSDQPAASFQEPALENFAEAMFASGMGEPVFIGGDFGDVEQTKAVVLAAAAMRFCHSSRRMPIGARHSPARFQQSARSTRSRCSATFSVACFAVDC
jgi:hypothetical protein